MPAEFEIGPQMRAFRGDDDEIVTEQFRKCFERGLVPADDVARYIEFRIACGHERSIFEDSLLPGRGGDRDVIDMAGSGMGLISVIGEQSCTMDGGFHALRDREKRKDIAVGAVCAERKMLDDTLLSRLM